MNYQPRPGLSPSQREIETRFGQYLEADWQGAIRRYRQLFGKIIDRNNAQELSDDYNRSRESRQRFALATHEPAGALAQAVYRQMLLESDPLGGNVVVFSGGGQGSGKTTAVERSQIALDAQIIVDGTLQDYNKSHSDIRAALNHHKRVVVRYVYRPFAEAVVNIVSRASDPDKGRVVEIHRAAFGHYHAPRNALRLAEYFSEEPGFNFAIIDNTGNRARLMSAERLAQCLPASVDALRAQGYREVDAYFDRHAGGNPALTERLRQLLRDNH